MTVHWWMHWFWITTVVAALLLVPLAAGHPTTGPTSPPSAAGGRSAHAGPRDWHSWPPPYEDEEDDEDGFLGPRALPLEGRPPDEPPEELVPQDADVDGEILAEYAREVAASRAAARNSDVHEGNGAPGEQLASKALTTRDVQNVAPSVSNSTVVDAVSSSQPNNSGSRGNSSSDSVTTGARESKSFSSSVAPVSVAPVKPLKAETGHNNVDTESKAGTARDRLPTSAPVAPASGSSTAAPESAEPQGGVATARAEVAPQDSSDAPQAGGVAASAEAGSPQPAEEDAYATAPAETVPETGPDASSVPPEEESGWTAYDASAAAAAAADDDVDVVGQQEEAAPRSRTAEREAADEEEVPEAEADAPVSRGRVAPAAPPTAAMDAASITGIALGIVVFSSLVGAVSFVMYRRRYLNKPQTLNDKCSNPDSSGYIDDSTLRVSSSKGHRVMTYKENSEEMYSLDNDSFLNSLEAMTIQNYWTDNVKHTKL
ncbi:skin secretory protein xP2-like isoform X1 [Schistocerca cancellata]|uniref:skin secretory protein xP2-like isoform X1 n=1 Tax=Schistocerca cancellata TaxID=274614 RepID=UPI0021174B10|nr:skin secretory protein xP2-like isoform X1 [Schistocerca cancellata]XP_049763023.1 skin secretory protein xP2-like isoform X1 [Schistocerca cancellata]XP_049763024.1 skin secretory protein xP2-like isoform X1 [Schistocerca cancellata]